MADTLTTTTTVSTIPNGTVIATDDAGAGGHVQIVKLAVSTDGSATALTANNTDGLLVNLGSNNDVTVTGTVAATQSGTWDEVGVNDSGNSLTVDAPVGTPVFVRLSDGSSAISTLPVSLASVPSHAVTNAGTFAVQVDGDALTALQLIDDIVKTDDAAFTPATSKVAVFGAEFDDTTPDSVDEGDAGALRMSANRSLYVNIRDNAGNERGLNIDSSGNATVNVTGTVTVGSHAVTNAGTFAVQVDGTALTRLTDIETNTDSNAVVGNGAAATAQRVTLANDSTGIVALTTSTASIGKLAANSGVDIGDVDVTSVPAPLSTTGGGTEATALRVTVASDSTGVLSVDDNGAALTVDNGGTFAVQVDGSALTSLQLLDDVVFAEDVAAQAADKGVAVLAVRRDADTSLVGTDNDYANLQVDANGYLKVEVFDGGGSHTVDNAGTFAVQVDGNALTALQLIDNPVLVDDAGFTPATSSVMMAGFEADEASTDSVDEGDAGAARMTLDRKIIVNPQPHTGGGLTIFRSLDLDETEEEVKATAGQIYAAWVTNTATTTRFLKFYNATAANVVVGSTTPVITIGIPGNSSDDISGSFSAGGMGIVFDTAITVAATTGVADADTGAPAANDVIVNIFYK